MSRIPSNQLLEQLHWRYAVKKFDPAKKIPDSDMQVLEESLILTPSSYGLQPWKFIIITDAALKAALLPHSWNQKQVVDCSHHVVFTVKSKLSRMDVEDYIDRICEVRGVARESLEGFKNGMIADVVTGPRSLHAHEWAARQAYIALGNLMTSAALLGVDACPMEGILPEKYDDVLGLKATGYQTACACALGYRSPEDFLYGAKKVRFPARKLVEHR